ncbi:DNA-binding protein [Lutibacter citreus]|uniref:DNA-binding protein n=1 Tax=Lutibacter citreus TaxID=2138210 RepID=UPI000DBE94CE|nr:DNA-binding protein [Lutibacter citreus]
MKYISIVFSVLLLISCKEKVEYSKINKEVGTNKSIHKIVVNEKIGGGTYAYLNVSEDGNDYWMAIPNSDVGVGETYFYEGGMVMKNFESKQLKKTFESIVFSEGIRKTEAGINKEVKNPHANSEHEHSPISAVKIEQPKGGTSLENIFKNKKSLSKKEVTVKGKVIKVNNGILKRNWVHIIDGTKFEKDINLTITTTEEVKVGDTVTFKGIVTLDKDFGYGYVYNILLEDGILIK